MRTPFTRIETQHREGDPESVSCVNQERYERCTFCNSKLIFTHDLNLNYLEVIETGRCPGCGVSLNPKRFTLQ